MPRPPARSAEPPDPAPGSTLDVPVSVWLAPHPHDTPAQPAIGQDEFALPGWAFARLTAVYADPSGPASRLRLWRPTAVGPLATPEPSDSAAGIVVDLTGPGRTAPHAGTVLTAARAVLQPGAYLFVVVACGNETGEEPCGPVVTVARSLGLAYLQHLVVVHGHADGDHIVPHPVPRVLAAPPIHAAVHVDVLVFRVPPRDTDSGGSA